MPVTRLTIIETTELEGDPEAWLASLREDEEAREDLLERALAHATRMFAARRLAAADPAVPDATREAALAVRLGFGNGDELVDGRYEQAIEPPRGGGRRSKAEALRPQERMAALISGRQRVLICEELLLRARADLDAGRGREATLQVRVALEALLAESDTLRTPAQEEDLSLLDGSRKATGEAANEALRGDLSTERMVEVTETVAVCERVLRRKAARG